MEIGRSPTLDINKFLIKKERKEAVDNLVSLLDTDLTSQSHDYVPLIPIYVSQSSDKEAAFSLDLDWSLDLP